MSIWYENAAVTGPATHALIVGVSHYRHLPGGVEPAQDDRETFGLGQLDCAATGALRFASWLAGEHFNPEAPCASIRLLLSPSEIERERTAVPEVPAATRENVEMALNEWESACDERPENMAVLYAAGHGIMVSKDDGLIVLLEDFARLRKNVLGHALDVPSIRRGMAGQTMARRQFYFVDACQVRPRYVSDNKPKGGVGFDEPAEPAPEVSVMFASAAPGSSALGIEGEGTLFSEALVDCLRKHAVHADDHGRYCVSATTLGAALETHVKTLAREHGQRQDTTAGGVIKPVAFHMPRQHPTASLTIEVVPGKASELAYASATRPDADDAFPRTQLHPSPFTCELPAGLYSLTVNVDPPCPQYRDPPSKPIELLPYRAKHVQAPLLTPAPSSPRGASPRV
jgi:hypothetical protein